MPRRRYKLDIEGIRKEVARDFQGVEVVEQAVSLLQTIHPDTVLSPDKAQFVALATCEFERIQRFLDCDKCIPACFPDVVRNRLLQDMLPPQDASELVHLKKASAAFKQEASVESVELVILGPPTGTHIAGLYNTCPLCHFDITFSLASK